MAEKVNETELRPGTWILHGTLMLFLFFLGVYFSHLATRLILLEKFERDASKVHQSLSKHLLNGKIAGIAQSLSLANQRLRNILLQEKTDVLVESDLMRLQSQVGASVIYVLNTAGDVVTSTPYAPGKTLAGNNYAFRDYFMEAMAGYSSVYAHLGVTTLVRGLYYSAPIRDMRAGSDSLFKAIGVVVIKMPLDNIDDLLQEFDGTAALTLNDNTVFACSNSSLILKPFSDAAGPEEALASWVAKDHSQAMVGGLSHSMLEFKVKPTMTSSSWRVIFLRRVSTAQAVGSHISYGLAAALLYGLAAALIELQRSQKRLSLQVQRKLHSSSEAYKTIFNTAHETICVHDPENMAIVEANSNVERDYGYSTEEIKTIDLSLLCSGIPPYSIDEYRHWFHRCLQEGEQRYEWLARRKNGTVFWAEVHLKLCTINQYQRVLAIVHDISDRKTIEVERLKHRRDLERKVEERTAELAKEVGERRMTEKKLIQRNALLQSIQEAVPNGLLALDELERVISRNTQFLHIWKCNEKELPEGLLSGELNKLFALAIHSNELISEVTTLLQDPVANYRKEWELEDQRIVRLESYPVNGPQKEFLGRLFSTADVTSTKLRERQLQRARDQAEAASRSKSTFLANMSHEIRTPLNIILGMAHLLESSILDKDQRRFVDSFQNAGHNLLHIINDILDVSTIEAGYMKLQNAPFHLEVFIERIKSFFSIPCQNKNIDLLINTSELQIKTVIADQQRLWQILMNLVGNAVKFTHEGSIEIILRNTPPEQGKTTIMISVIDTGIGIPEDRCDKIFESFEQVDNSSTREYGGTGLGLTICRNLTGLMKGKITLRSELGKGSEFKVEIPLEISALESVPITPSIGGPAVGHSAADPIHLKILLAEDVDDNVLLFQRFLAAQPWELSVAHNGQEALELSEKHDFDLILMDMQMPIMDGYTAVKKIRERESALGLSHMPIIALTAYAMADDLRRSAEAGCDAHLSKPVKRKDLIQCVLDNCRRAET